MYIKIKSESEGREGGHSVLIGSSAPWRWRWSVSAEGAERLWIPVHVCLGCLVWLQARERPCLHLVLVCIPGDRITSGQLWVQVWMHPMRPQCILRLNDHTEGRPSQLTSVYLSSFPHIRVIVATITISAAIYWCSIFGAGLLIRRAAGIYTCFYYSLQHTLWLQSDSDGAAERQAQLSET